jgi:tape measure domain-containing protein
MPTISSTLKMFDEFSGPIARVLKQMDALVASAEKVNRAMTSSSGTSLIPAKTVSDQNKVIAANQQVIHMTQVINHNYQKINNTVNQQNIMLRQTNVAINQATASQQNMNNSLRQGQKEAGGLWDKVKGIAAAYLSIKAAASALGAADTFISTQARLGLIVDEGQSVDQLKNNVFAAADRARGDFITMAGSASKLGLLAGDAFSDTSEIVSFTETMQKAFKVSGASIMEQTSGMYQLTQAMAAGKLQGDEFRSIMENAPMLADAIAKFTGKSKGDLKEMSAEGTITADIIKGALFAAADDINSKFETLPKTFGDIFQQFKNDAFRAFEPVFKRMNGWLNSAQGSAFVQSMTQMLYGAAIAADLLLGSLMWIIGAVQSGWGIIEPILVAITAAIALWALTQIPMLTAKLWLMLQPILAQAAAWALVNWPILLIGAAIGFLIYALYRWGDATTEVIGYVGGIFGVLFGFLYNRFAYFANIVMSVAEFFINVWKDPVYAVKKLFYDLVINSLQSMENLAKGIENIINKIPGLKVNITDGLGNLLKNLEDARNSLKSEEDVVKLTRFNQMDYGEAFGTGQKIGRAVGQFAADGVQKAFNGLGSMFEVPNFGSMDDNTTIGNIAKVGEVGKIRDKVDISSEDLKLMRELAEMKSIQNFVSLAPSVQVTTGPVNKESDIDSIIARIEDALVEQISSTAKGVYALG